jgi:heat shock protein HslJ
MTRVRARWPALVLLILAAGCSSEAPPPSSAEVLAEALANAGTRESAGPRPPDPSAVILPATFTGLLPCEHCPGVRYHLNLLREGTFHLRRVNLGSDNGTSEDRGTWGLAADRRTLTLNGPSLAPMSFVIVDDQTLRQVDAHGAAQPPAGEYELDRRDRFQPLESMLSAPSGAAISRLLLERRWALERVGSTSITSGASIEFTPGDRSFAGSDGCNRVAGSYRLADERITFTGAVVTRLECPGGAPAPMDLAEALRQTRTWTIAGNRLELHDGSGTVVAVFR